MNSVLSGFSLSLCVESHLLTSYDDLGLDFNYIIDLNTYLGYLAFDI